MTDTTIHQHPAHPGGSRRREAEAWGDIIQLIGDGEANTVASAPCDTFDRHLHRLGPTSTLIWLFMARLLADGHDTCPSLAAAGWAGIGEGQLWYSLERLVRLGYARRNGNTLILRVTA